MLATTHRNVMQSYKWRLLDTLTILCWLLLSVLVRTLAPIRPFSRTYLSASNARSRRRTTSTQPNCQRHPSRCQPTIFQRRIHTYSHVRFVSGAWRNPCRGAVLSGVEPGLNSHSSPAQHEQLPFSLETTVSPLNLGSSDVSDERIGHPSSEDESRVSDERTVEFPQQSPLNSPRKIVNEPSRQLKKQLSSKLSSDTHRFFYERTLDEMFVRVLAGASSSAAKRVEAKEQLRGASKWLTSEELLYWSQPDNVLRKVVDFWRVKGVDSKKVGCVSKSELLNLCTNGRVTRMAPGYPRPPSWTLRTIWR